MMPPMHPNPAVFRDGESVKANLYHRDVPGFLVLHIRGRNVSEDDMRTACSLIAESDDSLVRRLLTAISEHHSGDVYEGEKIARAVVRVLRGAP